MLVLTYRRMRFTVQSISHLRVNTVNARAMYYSVLYTSVHVFKFESNHEIIIKTFQNSAKMIVNKNN